MQSYIWLITNIAQVYYWLFMQISVELQTHRWKVQDDDLVNEKTRKVLEVYENYG